MKPGLARFEAGINQHAGRHVVLRHEISVFHSQVAPHYEVNVAKNESFAPTGNKRQKYGPELDKSGGSCVYGTYTCAVQWSCPVTSVAKVSSLGYLLRIKDRHMPQTTSSGHWPKTKSPCTMVGVLVSYHARAEFMRSTAFSFKGQQSFLSYVWHSVPLHV